MNYFRKLTALFSVFLFLFLTTGCVNRFPGTGTEHHTGDLLTPEDIESIFNAISTPVTERYLTETDSHGNIIVFWLEGGSVFHISSSCGSISKADPENVKSGRVIDALSDGKERACKICSSDVDLIIPVESDLPEEEKTQTESNIETDKIDIVPEDGVEVFWYANGTVWHESLDCSIVITNGADNIISGSKREAVLAGKQRVCQRCIKDNTETTYYDTEETTVPSGTSDSETVAEYPKEYDKNGSLIVYWLQCGSVWHESSKCTTVLNTPSEKLFIGTPSEAYICGKKRACKVCSADSDVDIDSLDTEAVTNVVETELPPVKYPKEYDADGELVVYWLESGSVWHESAQCGTVIKSDRESLNVGKPLEAYLAGKIRACKICSADSDIVIEVGDISESETIVTTEQIVEKYPRDYDSAGELIVYWLDSGTVWHESLYCPVLRDVSHSRIISGSISDAILSNKVRECKICSH